MTLSCAFAGYFYWWVIVSISWGLIASVIAIVLPVWEVRLISAVIQCYPKSRSTLALQLLLVGFHCARQPLSTPEHLLCRGLICALHPVQARGTIGAIIVHMLHCQSARPLSTALKKVGSHPLSGLAMMPFPCMCAIMLGACWLCRWHARIAHSACLQPFERVFSQRGR